MKDRRPTPASWPARWSRSGTDAGVQHGRAAHRHGRRRSGLTAGNALEVARVGRGARRRRPGRRRRADRSRWPARCSPRPGVDDVDPADALRDGSAMDVWRRDDRAPRAATRTPPLPTAPRDRTSCRRRATGVLTRLDALAVGVAAWRLGAGRARKEDPVQAGAGVVLHAKPGRPGRARAQPLLHAAHRRPRSGSSGRSRRWTGAFDIAPEGSPARPARRSSSTGVGWGRGRRLNGSRSADRYCGPMPAHQRTRPGSRVARRQGHRRARRTRQHRRPRSVLGRPHDRARRDGAEPSQTPAVRRDHRRAARGRSLRRPRRRPRSTCAAGQSRPHRGGRAGPLLVPARDGRRLRRDLPAGVRPRAVVGRE